MTVGIKSKQQIRKKCRRHPLFFVVLIGKSQLLWWLLFKTSRWDSSYNKKYRKFSGTISITTSQIVNLGFCFFLPVNDTVEVVLSGAICRNITDSSHLKTTSELQIPMKICKFCSFDATVPGSTLSLSPWSSKELNFQRFLKRASHASENFVVIFLSSGRFLLAFPARWLAFY